MRNLVCGLSIAIIQVFSSMVLSTSARAAVSENEVLAHIVALAKQEFVNSDGSESRYVGKNCHPVEQTSPLWQSVLVGYEGLPVQDCSPKKTYVSIDGGNRISVNARALVLLPNPETTATMVVGACKADGFSAAALTHCSDIVFEHIIASNGGQFIVAGVITEPKHEGYGAEEKLDTRCKKTAGEDILFSFRDGSTVRLKGRDRTSWREPREKGCTALAQPSDAELEAYLTTDPVSVKNYGRIADLHRAMYAACTGDKSVVGAASDANWRKMVKSNFIAALKGAPDRLLSTWALARLKPFGDCKID